MTQPIMLDLRNLTDEKVAEAMPHLGECFYSSPCIIGTLLSPEDRVRFDNCNGELGDGMEDQPMIGKLMKMGFVKFPDGRQALLARNLQASFDRKKSSPQAFMNVLVGIREELARD